MPHYPLKTVKALLKIHHFRVNPDVLQDAWNDFRWKIPEIVKCLNKLNDRNYSNDPQRNHFYKTKPRENPPFVEMDFYKIQNGPEGYMIYTHLYVNPISGKLIISSFHKLEI